MIFLKLMKFWLKKVGFSAVSADLKEICRISTAAENADTQEFVHLGQNNLKYLPYKNGDTRENTLKKFIELHMIEFLTSKNKKSSNKEEENN